MERRLIGLVGLHAACSAAGRRRGRCCGRPSRSGQIRGVGLVGAGVRGIGGGSGSARRGHRIVRAVACAAEAEQSSRAEQLAEQQQPQQAERQRPTDENQSLASLVCDRALLLARCAFAERAVVRPAAPAAAAGSSGSLMRWGRGLRTADRGPTVREGKGQRRGTAAHAPRPLSRSERFGQREPPVLSL